MCLLPLLKSHVKCKKTYVKGRKIHQIRYFEEYLQENTEDKRKKIIKEIIEESFLDLNENRSLQTERAYIRIPRMKRNLRIPRIRRGKTNYLQRNRYQLGIICFITKAGC